LVSITPGGGPQRRQAAEGKSKNEMMRCLKRYIAREVFHALQPRATAKTTAST
jgi:hypothetical protein